MANRTTKRDNFNAIIGILENADRPDLVAVMAHEIELLDRKNANRSDKPTATQIANAAIKDKIAVTLQPCEWYRLSQIKEMIPELADSVGTQKTAALCNAMEREGRLNKVIEKRVVYYALPM